MTEQSLLVTPFITKTSLSTKLQPIGALEKVLPVKASILRSKVFYNTAS